MYNVQVKTAIFGKVFDIKGSILYDKLWLGLNAGGLTSRFIIYYVRFVLPP